jgi:hypothetical protein
MTIKGEKTMAEEKLDGNDGGAGGENVSAANTMEDVKTASERENSDFSAGFDDDVAPAADSGSDVDDDGGSSDDDAGDDGGDGDGDERPRDDKGRFIKQDDDGDGDDADPDPSPTKKEKKPPAGSDDDDSDDADDADDADGKPDTKPEPPAPKVSRPVEEIVSEVLAEFADMDVKSGETSVNVKDYVADYPEEAAAAAAIAARVFEKMGVGGGGGEDVTKLQAELIAVKDELLGFHFWNEVSLEFPTARKTVAGREFGEWLNKQAKGIKKLAVSVDADDAVTVLRMFEKETKPKPAAPAKPKVNRGTLLHSDNARSSREAVSSGSQDDFDAGFNL